MRDISSSTFGPQSSTDPDTSDPLAHEWAAKTGKLDMHNRLYIGPNGFGSCHPVWDNDKLGSVVAARADGRPLLAQHLEALCAYISEKVNPRLSHALAGLSPGAVVANREAVLDSITPADFLDFFNNMKAGKVVTNKTWDIPSPYEKCDKIVDNMNEMLIEAYDAQNVLHALRPFIREADAAHHESSG